LNKQIKEKYKTAATKAEQISAIYPVENALKE